MIHEIIAECQRRGTPTLPVYGRSVVCTFGDHEDNSKGIDSTAFIESGECRISSSECLSPSFQIVPARSRRLFWSKLAGICSIST
eukprot:scaffold22575_cov141-Cylindrotheca_fusiformis.AAC.43